MSAVIPPKQDDPAQRDEGAVQPARPRLSQLAIGEHGVIAHVAGRRAVRRRLMEMGLVPGTEVTVTNVAPLGDPLELSVRHGRLSIRRVEAAAIELRRPRRHLEVK